MYSHIMNYKAKGFRRPFAISISSAGHIVCLSKAPKKKIYIFHPNADVVAKDLAQLGISDAGSLAINENDEIVILDKISMELIWFDLQLNKILSLELPGSSYGAMKFEKASNKLYVSVLDLFVVLKINSDGSSMSHFFDYSSIEGCGHVNGLAIKGNRLILLDTAQAALFDVSMFEGKFDFTKHLKYGKGGGGQVRNPTDVNIVDDLIVVHDYHNYFTQFFDKNLNFLYQVGGKGQGINQFDLPVSGYAADDDLYICDQNNDRVVLLNSKSRKFSVIAEDTFIEGYLRRPSGIAVDGHQRIYVADRSNGVIQLFDENLNFLEILSVEHGQLHRPSSIAVFENNGDKQVAIIERKSGNDSSLSIYSLSEDKKMLRLCRQFNGDIPLNDPQDMAVSKNGHIYVADTLNRRIIRVGFDGKLINQVDMVGISGNKRVLVKTIFVTDDDNVFTADFDKCIVYQFDSNLQIKDKIDFSSMKNELQVLRAVYATKSYLLLCVRGENQVLIADYQGVILKAVDCKKQTGLDWNQPVNICAIKNGSIFIADKENDRVIKFDNNIDLITHKTKEPD